MSLVCCSEFIVMTSQTAEQKHVWFVVPKGAPSLERLDFLHPCISSMVWQNAAFGARWAISIGHGARWCRRFRPSCQWHGQRFDCWPLPSNFLLSPQASSKTLQGISWISMSTVRWFRMEVYLLNEDFCWCRDVCRKIFMEIWRW